MNDYAVRIDIDRRNISMLGVDIHIVEGYFENIFFRDLRELWGVRGAMSRVYERDCLRISIQCPEMLAPGIERKLHEIVEDMGNREVYIINSHPYESVTRNRAQITPEVISDMSSEVPGSVAPTMDFRNMGAYYTNGGIVPVKDRPKEIIVEVPKLKRKRIVSIDIK